MAFEGQALNYNVFVKTVERINVTDGGIDITSETDKNEKYKKGVIVSFGNLCPKRPKKLNIITWVLAFLRFIPKDENVIKIGQEVIYDGYKSSPLSVEGDSFDCISFADLVCII